MKDGVKEKRREWSDDHKYCSFNSYKGLTWMDSHFRPTVAWLKGEGPLPPPLELSLDPTHLCNFLCGHCNAKRYLVLDKGAVPQGMRKMSKAHLEELVGFCAEWGVRGVCIGGGGEPLMNKDVWTLPEFIHNQKVAVPYIERGPDGEFVVNEARQPMQSSFATNGSLIDEALAEQMMHCRWVGVSLDSGTRETFQKVHGVNYFDRVVGNLRLLSRKKEESGSEIDLCLKFLIRPDNWHEVAEACKIAKDIGVRDFHARPADLERKDFEQAMQLNYDIDKIMDLFAECREMEDGDRFRVFTIMHKYDPKFRVMHTFKNCVSSSLMIQACSDGNVYVCADHRVEPRFKLGSHHPNPRAILDFWGGDEHRDLVKSVNVNEECGRCTYGEYARQIEEVAMEDRMCLDFP